MNNPEGLLASLPWRDIEALYKKLGHKKFNYLLNHESKKQKRNRLIYEIKCKKFNYSCAISLRDSIENDILDLYKN